MTIADTWLAPAKLNLFLHVTNQRPDGMHELQTVFQFLDYCDELVFQVRDDGVIQLQGGLDGVEDEDNLVVRAARALQSHTGTALGAEINLVKRLPSGGGLGGGSSDAATTLVALNQLWNCELSNNELAELGLKLGADVPIFVHGHAAWAEGVGEIFEPVDLPERWFLVIQPKIQVSTAEIFSAPELTRDCPAITIRDFLSGQSTNVCEPVVRHRHPEVDRALKWLGKYAEARMTGTGSCIFADFDTESQAVDILSKMPGDWQGFVAKGCNHSPLYKAE